MRPPQNPFRPRQKAGKSCTCSKGLQRILLDIDKAIAIVRGTEEESEVVPNLMIGFGIDQIRPNMSPRSNCAI